MLQPRNVLFIFTMLFFSWNRRKSIQHSLFFSKLQLKTEKDFNLMKILILQILSRFIIACESDNVAQQRKNSKEFKLSWKSQESWKEWEWEIKLSHDKASICSANGVKQTKAKIGYQVISNLYWHATNVGRSIRYTKMVSNLVI